MANSDLNLQLTIRADGTAAVTTLNGVSQGLTDVGRAGDAAAARLDNTVNRLFAINESIDLAQRVAAFVGPVLDMADAYAQLQARLGLAVEGFGSAKTAMEDVQRIADTLGVPLQSVGNLYTKLAGAAKTLKASQEQVAGITETFAKALIAGGAATAQADSAMLQFSQSMASGVFRGEEFNAVYEAAPYILDQIAKGLGVATGDMRRLAEAGALSAREVAAAMETQRAAIDAAYAQMPETVERATNRARNALAAYLADVNQQTGITHGLSAAIGGLSEHMDLLGAGAGAVAAGGLARLLQAGAKGIEQAVADVAARRAQAAQVQALGAAEQETALLAAEAAAARSRVAATLAAQTAAQAVAEREAAVLAEQAAQSQVAAAGAGWQRANAEGHLTLAIANREKADLLAAETAALAAEQQRRAAAATAGLAAAQTAGAAGAGVLSRALGLLGGPAGIVLVTVASFAALALAQRDSKQSAAELGDEIERLQQKLTTLSGAQLDELIKKQKAYQQTLREGLADNERKITAEHDLAEAMRRGAEASGDYVVSAEAEEAAKRRLALLAEENRRLSDQLAVSTQAQADAEGQLAIKTGGVVEVNAQRRLSAVAVLKSLQEERDELTASQKAMEASNSAATQQAQTRAALARSLGDEAGALRAEATAANLVVQQQRLLQRTTAEVLATKEQELVALRESGTAKDEQIVKVTQEIAVLQGEVAARAAATAESVRAAEQAQITAKTYGDQSAQLGQLREEHGRLTKAAQALRAEVIQGEAAERKLEAAQQRAKETAEAYAEAALTGAENVQELGQQHQAALKEVERLRDALVTGKAAAAQLLETDKALTKNKQLLTDASKDYQEKLKAETALAQTQANINRGLLEVKGLELQRRQAIAKAMGDEQAAASIGIQIAKLEVKETQLQAEALRTEAENLKKATEEKIRKAQETDTYTAAVKAETAQSLKNAEALEIEAQKLDASAKLKKTEISIAAALIDTQNAVNAVVEEYGQILAQAGEEAKKAGEAAIAAGANQYEAAEAAKRAAQAALDAAEQKVKADRESIAYTDLLATELAGLADQYEALGDTSTAAMLRSKEALGDYWQMWEAGRYPQEIQSLNEQLTRLGQRVAYVDNLTAALQSGSYSAAQLAEATRIAQTATERLGEERLEALRSAIQAAQQDMEDLKREADDTLASWQDKLDQLRGNELDIATRQRAADLADLQAQLDAAIAAGNAEAQARLRQSIDLAKTYWDEYIAGLKAADEAADNANLPGITVNDNGTISGTLPEIRSGSGGSGDGTISGALSARGASTATIAKEDVNALSEALGGQISSALSQVAAGFQASGAAQRTVRLDFNLGGQSVPISTSEADADKVIAAWADAKRRGL